MRRPDPLRQLPLEFGHVAAATRDDLVVGNANRAAVELVDRWPAWPSRIAAIVGPRGSGKSHLAAVWQHRAGALDASRLATADVPDVSPALVIEDVDAGALDETRLFHLINLVREREGWLLLTAMTPPGTWSVALADLASRLRGVAVAELAAPDDAMLAGIMRKLFADRQVEVDPALVEFLVRRMERSFLAAGDLVDALDRAALQAKTRVNRALASEVLERLEGGGRP